MPAAAIEPAVNVLLGVLASASMGAGVPAGGWPRAQLRVEDAKMILDVQKVKMLASAQKAWCPSTRPEQRCFRSGGQAPEGSRNRKQVTLYMPCPPASFAYTLLPTAARTQGVQQAASCAGMPGLLLVTSAAQRQVHAAAPGVNGSI